MKVELLFCIIVITSQCIKKLHPKVQVTLIDYCYFLPRRKKICEMATTTKRLKKMQLVQLISINVQKLFCPGTSRDREVCPGTFAPALVPGQRDTGTRKMSLSRDKGTAGRPLPVCPGTSRGTSRPVETLVGSAGCIITRGWGFRHGDFFFPFDTIFWYSI